MENDPTQPEIDETDSGIAAEALDAAGAETVQAFTFATLRSLTGEQTQEIADLSERFARGLASGLSAWLKADASVQVGEVKRATYGEFLGNAPEGTAYSASVQFEAVSALSLLQLDMKLGYCVLDLLLGGSGKTSLNTDLTQVDEQLFHAVMSFICDELSTSWRSFGLGARCRDRVLPTQVNRIMPPEELILRLTFEMQVGLVEGNLLLTLPAAVSSFLLRQLGGAWKGRREHPTAVRERLMQLSMKIPCQLALQLPSSGIAYGQIAKLAKGQMIELDVRESISPRLLLSGRELFEASAVSQGNSRAALLKKKMPS